MKYISALALALLVSLDVQAQEEEINVAGLVFLDYGGDLPADLLSSKSVVLVGTPAKAGESIREDWKPLVEEAHPDFHSAGVDAVGYYFYEATFLTTFNSAFASIPGNLAQILIGLLSLAALKYVPDMIED